MVTNLLYNRDGTLESEYLEEVLENIRRTLSTMRHAEIEIINEPVERYTPPGTHREYDQGPEMSIYIKGYIHPDGNSTQDT